MRLRFENSWGNFGRGDLAGLDHALLAAIHRMVDVCWDLDQRDGGLRQINFLGVVVDCTFCPHLDCLGEYWSSKRQTPLGCGRYAHRIAVHAGIQNHIMARLVVIHELQHAFDDLIGYGINLLEGVSLTAAVEIRARVAEIRLLEHVPQTIRRQWLEDHERYVGPSLWSVNQRLINRLRAVESGDLRPLFDELFGDAYLDQILCEMNLLDRRLPSP